MYPQSYTKQNNKNLIPEITFNILIEIICAFLVSNGSELDTTELYNLQCKLCIYYIGIYATMCFHCVVARILNCSFSDFNES